MGVVATDPVALAEPAGFDHGVRLRAAGYVLDPELELWFNRALDRALDARIAANLTRDQLDAWIAAGC